MESNEEHRNPSGNSFGTDMDKLLVAYRQDPAYMAAAAYELVRHNPDAAAAVLVALTQNATQMARTVDRLEKQVSMDGLTGAYNKAYLMTYLSHSYSHVADERRQKHGGDVLLMIDLDGFKPINDTLGHEAGDEALKRVVSMLQDKTRETDMVVRAGGDEFIVLLRGTEETDAVRKADQISDAFKTMSFTWGAHDVPVRASIGICRYDSSLSPQDNLGMADEMMFEVKRAKGDTRHKPLVLAGGPT